jgi:DNA-binding transcriptional LysR family regulator
VQIQVVEDTPQFLEHLLINGELDLAIMVTNALGDPQALVVEELTRSQNRVWMASGHPLAGRGEPSLAECAQQQQIVLEADRIEAVIRSVWSRHQLQPRVMMRTSSLEAARSLIGTGAAIAVLPDFLYRPWTLDADHIEVRNLRDAVPASTWAWCGGAARAHARWWRNSSKSRASSRAQGAGAEAAGAAQTSCAIARACAA